MNWTGGRLSRHSRRADSSTTSKQKQHFAKMRSHLMSGSVKKGPAKRPSFNMAAPQPLDEKSVRDGTVRTTLQQSLEPFSHHLHTYDGLYGENKCPGRVENSRHEQSGYPGLRNGPQSSIHSYETKPEPIGTIEPVDRGYELQGDMEAIRRKRFRILREGDWLGLSIQRPLQLKYIESESRDAIGKRRKLNSGYEAQYSRVQDKITSPFAPNRHIPSREMLPKPGQNTPQTVQYGQTPGGKGSVRIFIDGRERYVRESSGSVINRPHPEYVQSPLSSDVMLLDLEVGGSRQRPPHQLSSDIGNGGGYIPKPVEDGRLVSDEKSISSFGDYPSSGPLIHQTIGPNRNIYARSLQHQSSPIFAMDSTKANWPGASPVIYQPTPKSSRSSQLLRSHSSAFEGSIVATAGRKGTVTASVAQDEEMWRSWLVTENDDEESPTWPVEDQSDELTADGPGTSTDTTQGVSPILSPVDHGGRSDESGHGSDPVPFPNPVSSAIGSPGDDNLGNYNKTPSLQTVGTSKRRGPASDDIQLPTEPQKWKPKEKNQDVAWEAFVLNEPSKNLVDAIVEPQKHAAQEDPDAAWKKFILSSDPNDGNTTFSTKSEAESRMRASHKWTQGSSSSKTSLQVHPAATVIHSDPGLDQSSHVTSGRAVYKQSTNAVPSGSIGSDASGSLSGTSMHPNGSAHRAPQASGYFPQATGKPLKMVINKQRISEDPLARYMPLQSPSEQDIFMAKGANLPAPNESFERGLDDSLKQALHIGRRYAKQEKERYTKQENEAYAKQEEERYAKQGHGRHAMQTKKSLAERKSKETRDIYDIPISDDTE